MSSNQPHLPASSDQPDDFDSVPNLPRPSERRWTVRRKAAVIEAVRGGWVPIEEVCRLYTLSVDEFLAAKKCHMIKAGPDCYSCDVTIDIAAGWIHG